MSMEKWADYTKWPRDDYGFTQEVVDKIAKWRKSKTSSGDAPAQNKAVDVKDRRRRILTEFLNGNISRSDAICELRKSGYGEMISSYCLDEAMRRKQDGQEKV